MKRKVKCFAVPCKYDVQCHRNRKVWERTEAKYVEQFIGQVGVVVSVDKDLHPITLRFGDKTHRFAEEELA